MMEEYPCTGAEGGIYEISKRAGVRKTLWTKDVCCRGANLCVALSWLIRNYATLRIQFLAFNRIGTHSVECLFETTRAVLPAGARWERFLSDQVDAVMIGEIQGQLCLRPYIRLQNTVAGVTVCLDDVILVEDRLSFDTASGCVSDFADLLLGMPSAKGNGMNYLREQFEVLNQQLDAHGLCQRPARSSATAGVSIIGRFHRSHVKEEMVARCLPRYHSGESAKS
jgi:hypothetical protein